MSGLLIWQSCRWIDQPGGAMHYGCSMDLLGFLIARIEGASLGAVLERRIFGPLAMEDTSFLVPAEKRDRRAAAYGFDEQARLTKRLRLCPATVRSPPSP